MNAWPSWALGGSCKSPQGAEMRPGCNLGGAAKETFSSRPLAYLQGGKVHSVLWPSILFDRLLDTRLCARC